MSPTTIYSAAAPSILSITANPRLRAQHAQARLRGCPALLPEVTTVQVMRGQTQARFGVDIVGIAFTANNHELFGVAGGETSAIDQARDMA